VSDAVNDPADSADPDVRLRARAAEYLSGEGSAAERAAFELEFARPDGAAARALREAKALAGELLLAAPPVAPRPLARERLLDRVRAERPAAATAPDPSLQPWKQWTGGGGEVFRGHADGGFEATAIAGIFVRRLHVDAAAGRSTMLVRMAPGTRYPGHRHGGHEECYVLSGDLRHGERVMRGGDFERVDTGSRHGEQWTEEGCLLLIHSSHADVLE